jgi:hypothetical protein
LEELFEMRNLNYIPNRGLDALENQPITLLSSQLFRADHQSEAGTVNKSDVTQIQSEFALRARSLKVCACVLPNLLGIGGSDLPMPKKWCDGCGGSQSDRG